ITDNEITGDLAGRDIDKSSHIHIGQRSYSQMRILLQKFKEEEQNSSQLSAFIEDLDYFNTQKENETVVGLESKLNAGNRSSVFEFRSEERRVGKECKYHYCQLDRNRPNTINY